MTRGAAILGIGAAVVVVGGGTYWLYRQGDLSQLGVPGPGGTQTQSSITVTLPAAGAGTEVSGPSPGARGENLYPALWAIAPQSLPSGGFGGGPPITRPQGDVWVVIATNLTVQGTYNGQTASSLGPWVGIAEYADGTLVRVYPQLDLGGAATIGSWSGGYGS